MATDLTPHPTPTTLDLSGLPEPVVQDIKRLVETLRAKLPPPPSQSVIGMFADQGIKTLSLEEFQAARREMWANFPREFPDSGE